MKVYQGGHEILLGPRLGEGADGAVYQVEGDSTHCIKIFAQHSRANFIGNLPRLKELVRLSEKLKSDAALPTCLVSEKRDGAVVGFGMARINGKEVHNLYGVSSRQVHFSGADFRFLVRAAKNTALATDRLHKSGLVIGDISGRNLMVRADSTVSWIDADSFLIGNPYYVEICRLVTPEWTPPELQQDRHLTVPRTPSHDCFGLAVMIFHLLMLGRHPFQGRFTARGDAPDISQNISNRWYAHAGYAAIPLTPPMGTPSVSHVGPNCGELFVRAFTADRPEKRPSASEWVDVLTKLESSLRQCAKSAGHFYSSFSRECPWCRLLPEYGNLDPFSGALTIGSIDRISIRTALGAEIAAIIESLNAPSGYKIAVFHPPTSFVTPTWRFSSPGWLASLLLTSSYHRNKLEKIRITFQTEARRIEGELNQNIRLQQEILNRISVTVRKFKDLQSEARKVLTESVLRTEASRQLEAPILSQQRLKYLAGFRIVAGQIAGIGQKRISELAGHGIFTAADVDVNRIGSIPGFGPGLRANLHDWRREKELGFRPASINIPAPQVEQRSRQVLSERAPFFRSKGTILQKEFFTQIAEVKLRADESLRIQAGLDISRANISAVEAAIRTIK